MIKLLSFLSSGDAKGNLQDKSGASLDWSKAGELGDMDAYDLIKKYCKWFTDCKEINFLNLIFLYWTLIMKWNKMKVIKKTKRKRAMNKKQSIATLICGIVIILILLMPPQSVDYRNGLQVDIVRLFSNISAVTIAWALLFYFLKSKKWYFK